MFDIARSLIIHASLPSKFWGKCILTTTRLINKLSSAMLNWNPVFEVLFFKTPSFSHFRTIGCLTHVAIIGPQRIVDKFALRGIKSILIDYSTNQKGYKMFDLVSNEILLNRDVIFFLDVFPFKDSFHLPLSYTSSPTSAPITLVSNDDFPASTSDPDPHNSSHSVIEPLSSSYLKYYDSISQSDFVVPLIKSSSRSVHPFSWKNGFVTPSATLHVFSFHLSHNLISIYHLPNMAFLANFVLCKRTIFPFPSQK